MKLNGNEFRRAYGVAQVADMFSVSRDTVKRAVKNGTIKTIRLGGRVLITAAELARIEVEGFRTPASSRTAVDFKMRAAADEQ